MIYLLGLQLIGPGLAQLLHLTFFGMTLVLTPGLVRAIGSGSGMAVECHSGSGPVGSAVGRLGVR